MTHFSLFTGIGGIDLAAEWAGFETIGQVEFADYPYKVLEKHWPNVPKWRKIQDVCGEEVRQITGQKYITLISGGFPCQPFSVAGRKRGKEDDRYLWPEMLRVIQELKPSWVLGENVNGFVNMALEDACVDLENEGYEVQPFVIPACAVGAWHERKRVFIVAYSKHNGRANPEAIRKNNGIQQETKAWEKLLLNEFERISSLWETTNRGNTIFADPDTERLQGQWEKPSGIKQEFKNISNICGWNFEPNVGRVANGVPSRVDRLKCLGNAVVPQQVYPILKYIAEIERERHGTW